MIFVLHLAPGVQDVKFWPSLPKAKLAAFRRMKMCNVVKVILKFDRAALPPLLHGCICSESFIPEFWFRCGGMPKLRERAVDMTSNGKTCKGPGSRILE